MKVEASAISKFKPPRAPNPPISIPDIGNLPPKTFVKTCGAIPPRFPTAFVSPNMLPVVMASKVAPTASINLGSAPKGPDNDENAPTMSLLSRDCKEEERAPRP